MFLKFLFNSLKQIILNVSFRNSVLKYNPDTSTRITLFFCNWFIQKNSLKYLKFLSTLNMRLKKYLIFHSSMNLVLTILIIVLVSVVVFFYKNV